jgi:hypothetical protein
VPHPPPSPHRRALARAALTDLLIIAVAGISGFFVPHFVPGLSTQWSSAVSAMLTVVFTVPLLAGTPTSLLKLALVRNVRSSSHPPIDTTAGSTTEPAAIDAHALVHAAAVSDTANRAAAGAWLASLADDHPFRDPSSWRATGEGTATFPLDRGAQLTATVSESDPTDVTYSYTHAGRSQRETVDSFHHLLRLMNRPGEGPTDAERVDDGEDTCPYGELRSTESPMIASLCAAAAHLEAAASHAGTPQEAAAHYPDAAAATVADWVLDSASRAQDALDAITAPFNTARADRT